MGCFGKIWKRNNMAGLYLEKHPFKRGGIMWKRKKRIGYLENICARGRIWNVGWGEKCARRGSWHVSRRNICAIGRGWRDLLENIFQEEEADGLIGEMLLKESVSVNYEAKLKVETYGHVDMAAEDFFLVSVMLPFRSNH